MEILWQQIGDSQSGGFVKALSRIETVSTTDMSILDRIFYFTLILTKSSSNINSCAFSGNKEAFSSLAIYIENGALSCSRGETFNIDHIFGEVNSATAKFFVMCDGFDPSSMDELIVSERQDFVDIQK